MKKIIYTLAFISFSCFAFSQWNELGGTNSLYNLFSTPISTIVTVGGVYADDLGNIYTSCYYDYPGPMPNWDTGGVVKWNGSSWQRLGKGTGAPIVTYSTNNVYAVGGYNPSNLRYVAQWDGNHSWYELGGQNALGANGSIFSLCVDSTGNLYAAGNFKNSSGKPYVAKWNGSQWSQLGGNISNFYLYPQDMGPSPKISSICSDGQGNIYAVGSFTNATGHFYVAKWDGNVWSELGGTNSLNSPTVAVNGIVPLQCVTSDKYGNIYTAGRLGYVAKWNGTVWEELTGTNGIHGIINSLTVDKYDNVYALSFRDTVATHNIYKWNGNDWIALPNFNSDERAGSICIDTAGNLYTSVIAINGYVAKYDKAYTVSIEEHTNEKLVVKIYPNHASEIINVECEMLNEETEIKIIDVLGKTVIHHSTFNISNSIDVSHLSNGIYFLQLKTDKSVGVKKFVVQR
ncbi:MAG: T9SS type A sorting domain-containing protein [Bacteroidetes bacterium]|nr:T9SS type A sorting domain-containing protein [Bacteroidota bacterium]